jgi:hypothetical protein
MLIGANLNSCFWPYAFHAYLCVKNAPPLNEPASSPDLLPISIKPNFHALRTFVCQVWVRPPGSCSEQLQLHAQKGIFLGFLTNTTKNFLWYDLDIK